MQFYQNHPDDAANIAAFTAIIVNFPDLSLFQPNAEKAPWHVQAVIDIGQYPVWLNFWPHRLKAQREGCKAVEGASAIQRLIEQAYDDALSTSLDDINLIEGV